MCPLLPKLSDCSPELNADPSLDLLSELGQAIVGGVSRWGSRAELARRRRMSNCLAFRFEKLQRKVQEPPQVLERLGVDDSFTIRLVAQLWVAVMRDFDETHDLVVAQAYHGIVYTTLVESQPVIMRLAIGPHAEPVAVDAHARPLPQ